jgi:hypothetical protein
MKKIIPIFLTILMMTALIHFSVATHYCSGNQVATSVSLSGKLATCGMEDNDNDLPPAGTNIRSHCCDNVISFFGITNSYFPAFSFIPESFPHVSQLFFLPAELSLGISDFTKTINASVSPPGYLTSRGVDLTAICVFRI